MKIRPTRKSFIWGVVLIVFVIVVALGSQMAFNGIGLNSVDLTVRQTIQEWAEETTNTPETKPEEEADRVKAAQELLNREEKLVPEGVNANP